MHRYCDKKKKQEASTVSGFEGPAGGFCIYIGSIWGWHVCDTVFTLEYGRMDRRRQWVRIAHSAPHPKEVESTAMIAHAVVLFASRCVCSAKWNGHGKFKIDTIRMALTMGCHIAVSIFSDTRQYRDEGADRDIADGLSSGQNFGTHAKGLDSGTARAMDRPTPSNRSTTRGSRLDTGWSVCSFRGGRWRDGRWGQSRDRTPKNVDNVLK